MKRGSRLRACLLFLLLTSVLAVGCWDRREIEERTSVVALAVDRPESTEPGQPMIKVSVQIPIPIKIAGAGGGQGGEGGKSAVKVMSATGYSMSDAIRNLQTRLNQELFYGHTRVIAVSEKVAQGDMAEIVDSLRRSPQMRRLLWLVITKGDAIKLLQADPKLEQIPIVYTMDLLENGAKSGRVPDITLGRWFIDRSSSGIEATANYIVPSDKEVKWHGLAVFRDDHMVGHIEESESWVLLNVRDKAIGGNVTVPCPGSPKPGHASQYVSTHPKKVHVKYKVEPYGRSFHMKVSVLMEEDIIESNCETDFTKEGSFVTIEKALTDEMNQRAKKLIQIAQSQFKADIFGMGNKVRAKYISQFEAMQWNEEFPNAKIEIEYQVKVRRAGMKMQ